MASIGGTPKFRQHPDVPRELIDSVAGDGISLPETKSLTPASTHRFTPPRFDGGAPLQIFPPAPFLHGQNRKTSHRNRRARLRRRVHPDLSTPPQRGDVCHLPARQEEARR